MCDPLKTVTCRLLRVVFAVALILLADVYAQRSRAEFRSSSNARLQRESSIKALEVRMAEPIAVRWNRENDTPVELTGRLTNPGAIARAGGPERAAQDLLGSLPDIFGLRSVAAELRVVNIKSEASGAVHVLFDRVYKGLRVFPSQVAVHFDAGGAVTGVNGRYHPSFDLDITPAITAAQALAICQSRLGSTVPKEPRTELFIWGSANLLRLAWEVRTPVPGLPNYRFVVDAVSGEVLVEDRGIIS